MLRVPREFEGKKFHFAALERGVIVQPGEFYGLPEGRVVLRLLTQPIHRYANPEQGILDGGLFVFAHGGNPEVVLVIEARETEEKETWMYAFSRVAYAELRIKLDDTEIWKVPQLKGNDVGPNDPYWLSWLAIPPGE